MTSRVRDPIQTDGISANAAARKYAKHGLRRSTLFGWVKDGDVPVVKEPAFNGDAKLLDDAAIQRMLQRAYTPHKDNASKRTRRAAPLMYQGADGQTVQVQHTPRSAPDPTRYQPLGQFPAAPVVVDQETSTRVWTDRYVEDRRVRSHGVIRAHTMSNYKYAYDAFCERFPVLPLETPGQPPAWRTPILDWVRSMRLQRDGGEMAENTKIGVLRAVASFYNWLNREYGMAVPNLKDSGLVRGRGPQAIPIFWDEIREVLRKGALNKSEHTLILALAQTGARLGELHTIRPELMDLKGTTHWTYVWGKPTKSNRSGQRPLALPDETYDALKDMFKEYGEMVWIDGRGMVKPLAGPVESTGVGAINYRDEGTFQVAPRPGMVSSTGHTIRRMVQSAGVYQPGKTAHAFRRGYQAEFVRNGGSSTFMRMIMGHFNVGDMDDLYTHSKIGDMVQDARAHAPRRFLTDEVAEDADHEATMAILADLEDDPE